MRTSPFVQDNWNGRGDPVACPMAPDLSPLDYSLWSTMKIIMYYTPVNSEMDLVAKITVAVATICKSQIYSNIFRNPCPKVGVGHTLYSFDV